MDKGQRNIKREGKSKRPFSVNTEVWLSDYFWPFFSNYSYQDIVRAVLEILLETAKPDTVEEVIPDILLQAFGDHCKKHGLIDANGYFNDARKLVDFFVGQ